jgi:hypothetical protein
MVIIPEPLFESDKDMIYAVKLNGEERGFVFDFPKGLSVKEVFLFALSNEMDILKIKQHSSIIYNRKWGEVNHTNKKDITSTYPDKEEFTCFSCPEATICKFSFELFNVNGDCEAINKGNFNG